MICISRYLSYGYVVAFVSLLGNIMSVCSQSSVVAVTVAQMTESLQTTRQTISFSFMVAMLLSAVVLPSIGRLLDRLGPRRVFCAMATGLALACWVVSRSSSILGLFAGFTLLRIFGQGGLSLVCQTMVNLWFVGPLRAKVDSFFMLVFMGLSQGVAEITLKSYSDKHGWRSTFWLAAKLQIFPLLLVGALFVRNKPEDYGLCPQGVLKEKDDALLMEIGEITRVEKINQSDSVLPDGCTLQQARQSALFWMLLVGTWTVAISMTGFWFHVDQFFEDRTSLSYIYLSSSIAAMFGCFAAGWIHDNRRNNRYVQVYGLCCTLEAAMLLALAVSSIGRSSGSIDALPASSANQTHGSMPNEAADRRSVGANSGMMLIPILVGSLQGLVSGMLSVLQGVVFVHHFGRRHSGEIQGFNNATALVASAIGPWLYGWMNQALPKSINLLLASVLPAAGAVCIFGFLCSRPLANLSSAALSYSSVRNIQTKVGEHGHCAKKRVASD